jgi:hypothetical protein
MKKLQSKAAGVCILGLLVVMALCFRGLESCNGVFWRVGSYFPRVRNLMTASAMSAASQLNGHSRSEVEERFGKPDKSFGNQILYKVGQVEGEYFMLLFSDGKLRSERLINNQMSDLRIPDEKIDTEPPKH